MRVRIEKYPSIYSIKGRRKNHRGKDVKGPPLVKERFWSFVKCSLWIDLTFTSWYNPLLTIDKWKVIEAKSAHRSLEVKSRDNVI